MGIGTMLVNIFLYVHTRRMPMQTQQEPVNDAPAINCTHVGDTQLEMCAVQS